MTVWPEWRIIDSDAKVFSVARALIEHRFDMLARRRTQDNYRWVEGTVCPGKRLTITLALCGLRI